VNNRDKNFTRAKVERRRAQLHQDILTGDDLPAAFERAVKERAEGLITTAESIFGVLGAQVTELAARHRLPAMYPNC
jgi:putative ABC transport system substrate-binding protein